MAVADTGENSLTDPGERGTLIVKDKVVERLATKAALDTDGVLPRAQGLDKLTGRDLPRVRVQISGHRVRAGLDIAARWPTPLTELTDTVRSNVARALTAFGGLQVDGIDVSVPAIIVDPDVAHSVVGTHESASSADIDAEPTDGSSPT